MQIIQSKFIRNASRKKTDLFHRKNKKKLNFNSNKLYK